MQTHKSVTLATLNMVVVVQSVAVAVATTEVLSDDRPLLIMTTARTSANLTAVLVAVARGGTRAT